MQLDRPLLLQEPIMLLLPLLPFLPQLNNNNLFNLSLTNFLYRWCRASKIYLEANTSTKNMDTSMMLLGSNRFYQDVMTTLWSEEVGFGLFNKIILQHIKFYLYQIDLTKINILEKSIYLQSFEPLHA